MGINKDQVEGRVKEVAGKAQEVAGRAVGNTTQEVKGAIYKNLGKAQAKVGDLAEKAHGAVKDAERETQRRDELERQRDSGQV